MVYVPDPHRRSRVGCARSRMQEKREEPRSPTSSIGSRECRSVAEARSGPGSEWPRIRGWLFERAIRWDPRRLLVLSTARRPDTEALTLRTAVAVVGGRIVAGPPRWDTAQVISRGCTAAAGTRSGARCAALKLLTPRPGFCPRPPPRPSSPSLDRCCTTRRRVSGHSYELLGLAEAVDLDGINEAEAGGEQRLIGRMAPVVVPAKNHRWVPAPGGETLMPPWPRARCCSSYITISQGFRP
jgi:hypothetical protein